MIHSIQELIWLFIIYAFLGWCLEVIYAQVHLGKFVNRGFLNGPYCPIYGVGVIIILSVLDQFRGNIPVLFIGSVLLTTFLELVTGYVLERIFNQKWWDYTDEPYNLKGYVCLAQSLIWGLACIFVVYVVQPIVNGFVKFASNDVGDLVQIFLIIVILLDIVITILALLKAKHVYKALTDIGEKIRGLSDTVGKNISNNTKNAIKTGDKNLQELEQLKNKYQAIIEKKIFGYQRITKAFPKLRSIKPKKPKF